MNLKSLFLILLFLTAQIITNAQQLASATDSVQVNKRFPTYKGHKHMIYAEVFGSAGGLFSLNYENVIKEKKKSLVSVKIGISISPVNNSIFGILSRDNKAPLYIPVIIERNYSRKKKYGYFEYTWGISPYYYSYTANRYDFSNYDTVILKPTQISTLGFMGIIKSGFRFQSEGSDWFVRIGAQLNLNLLIFGDAYYKDVLLTIAKREPYIGEKFIPIPTLYLSLGRTF